MAEMNDDNGGERHSVVRFTVVVQSRHTLDSPIATGRQIKEKASIPADYSLHRRAGGGTETIPNDELVEVSNGDHFFAQPRSQPDAGHSTDA